jgi:hypothetical protein
MQNAHDQNACFVQPVDDQMRTVGMQTDGRREFRALARHAGIFCNQIEDRRQPFMISFGLGLPERPASVQIYVDNVLIGLPCGFIRHDPAFAPRPAPARLSIYRRSSGR